jgi:pteridine reductase
MHATSSFFRVSLGAMTEAVQPAAATSPRRVALVTGGAKRVGRAIVEALARDGWDVAFTFKSSQREALFLQNDLSATGVRVLPLTADFDRLEMAINMIRERMTKWSPRLDLIVNSASAYATDEKLSADAAMRTNYVAPRLLIETFKTELRHTRGNVINMLDILAERPMPSYSNYCASKAALWNATLSDARRLAPEVRVNGIAPGVVEWPAELSQSERDRYVAKVPLARAGTPDDVVRTLRFLVNEAPYVTGQIIRLDGGRSLL